MCLFLYWLLGLRFWLLLGPSLMLLPIWYSFLLRKDLWSWIRFRIYKFLLLFMMFMLLFPQQFYCLLKINNALHYSFLFSLQLLLQSLSSSLDWDTKSALMVILISSCFSFLGEMCVGFKGFLFLINLSFRFSFLLLSSCGSGYFPPPPLILNLMDHFWKITFSTMAKWHTSFFGSLLAIPSIIFFWHFSHLIISLTNWKNIIVTQLTNFLWFALEIIIIDLLLKHCTSSF